MNSKPRLSVVIVSHNMARELPRTIRSLSPAMQRGIAAEDYEIVLVDNGSAQPLDEDTLRRWLPGLVIERVQDAPPSPVTAINRGLSRARGELVGVMIDGARMASPGLLAMVLLAERLHPRPVVGTFSFHLGPGIQTKSVLQGYGQEAEDRLLATVPWEEDGYRLFDISVPAGSSSRGWWSLPNESNALFLRHEHWSALGGYDPGFVTPGGGFANLDLWARLCADPEAQVIMLLGEATFHQVHGGIATNNREDLGPLFEEEYRRLRGRDFCPPSGRPIYLGQPTLAGLKSVQQGVVARKPARKLSRWRIDRRIMERIRRR